ncbi:hypothetical protein Syun_018239 [Stephania yunnanensis]|uniref:BHLH domain-containing protein n=1 Tax=Stephania yunnanensis TaxID=152371 RepID=A0AAP0NUU3_9MAGN
MNQCVPSWALNEPSPSSPTPKYSLSLDPMLDYEVAELTCENGHIVMHGLGPPRTVRQLPKDAAARANGTLESIVDQAAAAAKFPAAEVVVPRYGGGGGGGGEGATMTMAMDARVPGASAAASSTRVGSCSARAEKDAAEKKRARVAVVPVVGGTCDGCSRNNRSSVSGTCAHVGVDTDDMELETGFASTSYNTDADPTTLDERDSLSHSLSHSRTQEKEGEKGKGKLDEEKGNNGKSYTSTKRSRAAAIHNQSERKRRDKINQKMKTLQKLVPNSSKTDKASMLDEVIEYLKQLQAQIQIMSRMGMPNMMMNMTMQQQLQMSMMAQMGLAGMGMGMGMMDMNPMARAAAGGLARLPSPAMLNPASFLHSMASWDGAAADHHRMPPVPGSALPTGPMAAFLANQQQQQQQQPMNMDTFSRMAALYQQLQQQQQQQHGQGGKT